jgi:hypothetical protein
VQVEGSSHALPTGSLYRVGRDPRSDIVLTDPRVSWAHAVLRAEGGTWFIEDLGSTNGTFVGSQRISRYRITQDCTLRLANPADGPVMTCSLAGPAGRPGQPPPARPQAGQWPPGIPWAPGYGAAEQGPAPVAPPPDLPATLTGRDAPPSAPGDDAYAAWGTSPLARSAPRRQTVHRSVLIAAALAALAAIVAVIIIVLH